ncbi:hypothetical protein QK289_15455 [Exiguobacterium antarcticum]|uniref:Uncharacterized protein n=1 Tax=Exiguobacterium antarcticum TaxID=132920 RepID=A0ABT6R809_9BACL|nr:hypothetical protein [Exiguobacterium antarcticum]MDI3236411.1 hypothetical protein [Exiguobacterium antarcticum]
MQIPMDHINFKNLDIHLKHLSNEQIYQVISKYYNNEKIQNILEEYDINVPPGRLVRIFPTIFLKENCIKCGSQLLGEFESKTGKQLFRVQKACVSCSHEKESYHCPCDYCSKERKELKIEEQKHEEKQNKLKRKVINIVFSSENISPRKEKDLSLEDRFYLSVILRASLSEDMKVINPLIDSEKKLAPTTQLALEILHSLSDKDLLTINLNSDLDAFSISTDTNGKGEYSYFASKVMYNINIEPEDGSYKSMIHRLSYPESDLFTDEFCYEMWRKVSLNEVEEYLLFEMNKVGYSFNPGEKTYKVFEFLLDHFSTAQICNIIYRAISNSTRRYQAREISKIHAQNSVITSCESQGHRAIAENWKLTPYRRNFDLPETLISEVLFNSIMKITTLGYLETPTRNFR